MIDPGIVSYLQEMEKSINDCIDSLIVKRQSCENEDKYLYRYVNNKLQIALTAVNKALDKVENKS